MIIESILRQFLDSPRRRAIVITLSFVIGLATLWPWADEYSALGQEKALLENNLATTRQLVERLDPMEARADELASTLRSWDEKTFAADRTQRLRGDVVQWAKGAGCQVQQIRFNPGQTRPWQEPDQPLAQRTKGGKETPFQLTTRTVFISVLGRSKHLGEFLKRLSTDPRLIHTKNISLRPVRKGAKDVVLEMELMLFDLTEKKPVVSA